MSVTIRSLCGNEETATSITTTARTHSPIVKIKKDAKTEKTMMRSDSNDIWKIHDNHALQHGGIKPDLQSNRNDCAISDSIPSPSEESCRSFPFIPFSNTFGKSELLRKRELRLSIDSKPILRRRARSSEGYILRNRNKYTHEETPLEIAFHKETKCLSVPAMNADALHLNNESTENKSDKLHIIPVEHPFKIVWDIFTVILSVAHSYLTHIAIRDRRFEPSPFISFCQAWFLVDILLNFFTERKTSSGEMISDHRRIVARYLTSWFVIDVLSLFPWEVLYVKPLIELQNRRGFFRRSFFRSKAVMRVTTHLRGKHFRWFGTVSKHSKQHGKWGLLRLIIKYVPKYNMFLRNMKGVIAMRILRFVHWSRRSIKNIESKSSDASTKSMSTTRGDDDNNSFPDGDYNIEFRRQQRFEIFYDWEKIEDDDDGVPW